MSVKSVSRAVPALPPTPPPSANTPSTPRPTPAVEAKPTPAQVGESKAASIPAVEPKIAQSRFEVPPDQILVVHARAADGEARVRLEQAAPETGTLFDDVG